MADTRAFDKAVAMLESADGVRAVAQLAAGFNGLMLSMIATALREEREAALEDAAKEVDENAASFRRLAADCGSEIMSVFKGCANILEKQARDIRSLKPPAGQKEQASGD